MGQETLLTELNGKVGTIIINRPEKGNALTLQMLVKLQQTLERWVKEDSVRVVILTGAGEKAFCAGFDILSIPTEITPEMAVDFKNDRPLDGALDAVKNFPYPTIAKMNGYAFGAGLNLAVCCDFRFAVENVSVGMPPGKLGVVYHADGIKQFVDVIGPGRTREVFLTSETYKGKDAKEIGLVDKLTPRADLDTSVDLLIGQLAERAPLSQKGTKRILNMLIENSMKLSPSQVEEAEMLVIKAMDSDDLKEAQKAFLEKRKPVFIGK